MSLQRKVQRHSRRVAFLRVGLPLTAVILVVILFWSPDIRLINFSGLDVDQSDGNSITFSGKTTEGSAVEITASDYVSENDLILITRVSADIQHPDGSWHKITSDAATTNLTEQFIDLEGDAIFQDSNLLEVRSSGFRISLTGTSVESTGLVTFSFEGGNGRAGDMRVVRRDPRSPGGESWSLIELNNDVVVEFLQSGKSES